MKFTIRLIIAYFLVSIFSLTAQAENTLNIETSSPEPKIEITIVDSKEEIDRFGLWTITVKFTVSNKTSSDINGREGPYAHHECYLDFYDGDGFRLDFAYAANGAKIASGQTLKRQYEKLYFRKKGENIRSQTKKIVLAVRSHKE